ncbi:MAG: glycosyltransferase family 4 protein [Alphaproteobacteria bacterium]|nr:glycosyltransferase family 4 protein [Alphaproteobacteria bacterium]
MVENLTQARMKIVLLGTSAAISLHFRRLLIEKCIQEGHTVYVLCSDYTDSTKKDIQALGAIPVHSPLSRSMINPIRVLIELFQLKKIITDINPDMVFSFFAKPVIFGTLAAKFAGVKHICAMLEGMGYYFTKRPEADSMQTKLIRAIMIYLYRLSMPFAKALIVLNQQDLLEITNVYRIKPQATYVLGGIGVNIHQFVYVPPSQDHVNFLFVGRLLYDKGIREFITAAKAVKQKFPHVRFTVVGDIDPENPASLSAAEKQYLSEQNIIHFKGYKNDVMQEYLKASVFVLPSYREGVSLSIQEAMNVGRAVITASVPGCVDVIQDGRTGFIVPPFDAQAIENKMIYFIMNPEKVRELGYNAHSYAKRHFNGILQTEKLYDILMHDAGH